MRTKRINPEPEQLTERERAAMTFIQAYITDHRFHQAPTTEEIQAAIGLSLGGTHGLLQRLIEWGYLGKRYRFASPRNLRVLRQI
jgi:DNA-binding IclR family transcriptional regulator